VSGDGKSERVRSPELAAEAREERTAKLVSELVDQLGRMRKAAMKVRQLTLEIGPHTLPLPPYLLEHRASRRSRRIRAVARRSQSVEMDSFVECDTSPSEAALAAPETRVVSRSSVRL
jgi:hypothetical protein